MERIWVNRLCRILNLEAARSLVTGLLLHQTLVQNIWSNLGDGKEFVTFSEVVQLRNIMILDKWLVVRMSVEDLGRWVWIHKLLNINVVAVCAEEYLHAFRLYEFKVNDQLVYLVVRNDLIHRWTINMGSWCSNSIDRENISGSLIYLASHIVLLGRIHHISFSANILQAVLFFASVLNLNDIFLAIILFLRLRLLSFRENKDSIWFIDENHGFIFIALNFAYMVILQKVFNQCWFIYLADLVLL